MICKYRILLCFLLSAAGCDSSTQPDYGVPGQIRSIAYLKSLCPASGSRRINENIRLQGVVTANDLFGEFDKTLVIGDASGGIEISIDQTDLCRFFPLNACIEVSCNGLAVGDYGGKAVLGAPPTSAYSVDRIPWDLQDRYLRTLHSGTLRRRPELRTFESLGVKDAGRYVRFEGVRFVEKRTMWCDPAPETLEMLTTERTLTDAAGRTLSVRTLAGCLYAEEPLPAGTGSINGILDYFNGHFTLRVTNREFDMPNFAASPTADPSTAAD